jgi:hypothetical protein
VIDALEFSNQSMKFSDRSLKVQNPAIQLAINLATLKVASEYVPRGYIRAFGPRPLFFP